MSAADIIRFLEENGWSEGRPISYDLKVWSEVREHFERKFEIDTPPEGFMEALDRKIELCNINVINLLFRLEGLQLHYSS